MRKAALFIGALCVGLACGSPSWAGDRDAAKAALTKGMAYEKKGDLRSARIEYLNAIKADGDWTEAHIVQARVYIGLLDGVAAEAELRRAFELGTDIDRVRALLANALYLQGNFADARDVVLSGDVPAADTGYANRILGGAYMGLSDTAAARDAYNRALVANDKDSLLWVDIGRFRLFGGEVGSAVAAAERAIELDPKNVRALQFRGELLRLQYGLASALPWFDRALKLSPNDVQVMVQYAATLGDMGRMTEMLAMTRRILNISPNNANAFFLQSVLAARAGQFQLAQKLLQRTGGALDDVPAFLLVDGITHYQLGNWNNAISRFERLLSLQPDNARALELLARAQYRNGEFADVVAGWTEQAKRPDSSPYLLTLVGRAYEGMDNRADAAYYLNRAAQRTLYPVKLLPAHDDISVLASGAAREPNNALIVIPYIRSLLETGNTAAALAEATRLQIANPNTPDAMILLGDVQRISGDTETAWASFKSAAASRYTENVMVRMYDMLRLRKDASGAGMLVTDYLNANPGNLEALRMLASAHMDAYNWREAERMLTEARLRYGDNDPLLLADLAFATIKLGRASDAVAIARTAYRAQPASDVTTHSYGLALLESDTRKKDALDLLRKAYYLQPDNGFYAYNLARAYLVNQNKGRAKALLQRALTQGAFYQRDKAEELLREIG